MERFLSPWGLLNSLVRGLCRWILLVMKRRNAFALILLPLSLFPVFGEVKFSEKLENIAGYLGEGGAHYSVTDTTDDLKVLAEVIDRFITMIPDSEIPPGFKVESMFDDLGILTIQGQGSSSHQLEELWHNRTFLLTDGTHPGWLSLPGKEAGETVSHEFAPAGADLVLETSVDLRKLVPMARKMMKGLGPEVEAEVDGALMEKIGSTGMTLADFFMDFTVRGTLVFWLDEEKTFKIQPEVSYPVPHLAARLDNAGLVWTLLKSELSEDGKIVEENGEMILVPAESELESPFGTLEPRFVWVPETKQLYFSLTAGDLATCRGKGPRITGDKEFQRACEGFPKLTNGLAYASKEFLELILSIADDFSEEIPPEGQEIAGAVLPYLKDMAGKGGYAGAYSVEKDGFLYVANLPMPIKGGGSFSGLGGVTTIAMLAGMATPVISKARVKAEAATHLNELKMYAVAQLTFEVDEERFANSLEELLEAEAIDRELAGTLAGSGFEILVKEGKPGKGNMLGFLPLPGGEVCVAFADGSVRQVSMEEIEAILGAE